MSKSIFQEAGEMDKWLRELSFLAVVLSLVTSTEVRHLPVGSFLCNEQVPHGQGRGTQYLPVATVEN